MATVVFTNAVILIGGYDVSGQMNRIALEYGAETRDATAFGDGTRKATGGLFTARVSGTAWSDQPNPSDELFDNVGVDDDVVSIYPEGVTEGAEAVGGGFAFKSVFSRYSEGARVGDLLAVDFEAEGRQAAQ